MTSATATTTTDRPNERRCRWWRQWRWRRMGMYKHRDGANRSARNTSIYLYAYTCIYIQICMNLRTYRWRVYMHIVYENWLNHVGIGWWNMVSFSGRPKTVCAMEWCRGPQTPSPYTQRCTRETSDGPILLLDSWWTGWRDAGLESRGSLGGQRHSALTYFFFGFIVMLTLRLLYLFFLLFFHILHTYLFHFCVWKIIKNVCKYYCSELGRVSDWDRVWNERW